jgi:hypothetical protein
MRPGTWYRHGADRNEAGNAASPARFSPLVPGGRVFFNLYSKALVDPQYTVPHRHLFRLNPLHVFEQQSLLLRHLDKSGKHCRVKTGANVGRETGDEVGGTVGPTLGASVGPALGLTLGVSLGPVLGEALGTALGTALGSALGDALGPTLGEELGLSLGEALGAALGEALGVELDQSWEKYPGTS